MTTWCGVQCAARIAALAVDAGSPVTRAIRQRGAGVFGSVTGRAGTGAGATGAATGAVGWGVGGGNVIL